MCRRVVTRDVTMHSLKLNRKTQHLKKSAIESLCLAAELFNRPSQVARDQSVILTSIVRIAA